MKQNKTPFTEEQLKFLKTHKNKNNKKLLKEILYVNTKQLEELELIRSNTSKLVWWLVAIPAICLFLIFIVGGLKALF